MNRTTLILMPIVSLALLGCEDKSAPATKGAPPAAPKPAATGAAPAATGAEKPSSPIGALTNAATELKDKAVSAFTTKFDDVKKQIAGLKDKASTVPETTKSAYTSAMSSLDGLVKDAEGKLSELKSATGDAVKKAQDAFDGVMTKINESIAIAQKALAPK